MSLQCSRCGKKIETLPLNCGYSITMNYETGQMECDMGNFGIISFDKLLCERCRINKSLMKIYKNYETLSLESEELLEELKDLKYNIVQTKLNNPEFSYWVKFGEGKLQCGRGEIEDANILINCSHELMSKILMGNSDALSEFVNGNLKIEGDLQYSVVYFDLLKLLLDINKERVSVYNE
ncbi:MAG: SCP2 sterol-binding domain-containing protein [Candidatus Thorarchaeota archaeon]